MKIISKKPLCFTVSMKEISKNKMILSPRYYIEKEKHKEFNKWFKKLSLKDKEQFKRHFEFVKKLHRSNKVIFLKQDKKEVK